MNATLPETALILVAILPSQRDFDIARLFGWYRIPLKSAPKVISVDYLAFYQTKAFGEAERWQIAYVAQIMGHELTRRRDLIRDRPGAAPGAPDPGRRLETDHLFLHHR
jgi:hypothetical protein